MPRKPPRPTTTKAKNPAKDRRRSVVRVSDAEIVAELARNGGLIVKAAHTLGVRTTRVSDLSAKFGNLAELKKRETAYGAVEGALISLAGTLETVRPGHDADTIKALAIAAGIMADKLLLLAGKPVFIGQTTTDSTTTAKTVDLNDLFDKFSRAEVEQLIALRDKANGVDPPEELSDLDAPVNYDDATYTPPPVAPRT
jgi:hypothetical protein